MFILRFIWGFIKFMLGLLFFSFIWGKIFYNLAYWIENFSLKKRTKEEEINRVEEYYKQFGKQCHSCNRWIPKNTIVCPICNAGPEFKSIHNDTNDIEYLPPTKEDYTNV